MKVTEHNKGIDILLERDLNYLTVNLIDAMTASKEKVQIDLSFSKIVDSESIKSLYKMIRAGKRVVLVNPPPVLFEVIEILGLGSLLDDKKLSIIENRNGTKN